MEKICAYETCEKKVLSKGYCNGHYQQFLYGKTLKPLRNSNPNAGRKNKWDGIVCEVIVCKRNAKISGLCFTHYQRLRNMNITRDELILLTNVCEVCGTESERAHLDHNHDTGIVRGVLCHQCNIALGMIKENKIIAGNLIKYIEKYSD
jgi:hypothetical protein